MNVAFVTQRRRAAPSEVRARAAGMHVAAAAGSRANARGTRRAHRRRGVRHPGGRGAAAREMVLLGSSVKVAPIVEWDGRPIGDGQPGPAAKALLAADRRGHAHRRSVDRSALLAPPVGARVAPVATVAARGHLDVAPIHRAGASIRWTVTPVCRAVVVALSTVVTRSAVIRHPAAIVIGPARTVVVARRSTRVRTRGRGNSRTGSSNTADRRGIPEQAHRSRCPQLPAALLYQQRH